MCVFITAKVDCNILHSTLTLYTVGGWNQSLYCLQQKVTHISFGNEQMNIEHGLTKRRWPGQQELVLDTNGGLTPGSGWSYLHYLHLPPHRARVAEYILTHNIGENSDSYTSFIQNSCKHHWRKTIEVWGSGQGGDPPPFIKVKNNIV